MTLQGSVQVSTGMYRFYRFVFFTYMQKDLISLNFMSGFIHSLQVYIRFCIFLIRLKCKSLGEV